MAAAILLIGAPLLGLIFRSWGLGPWCSVSGLSFWGLIRQVRLGEHRSERFLGVALLLGGTFTVIDGLVYLLSGASP